MHIFSSLQKCRAKYFETFFEKIFNFCLSRELPYEEVEIINSFDIVFEFVPKTQFIDEEGSKDEYFT